uniref:UDENN domain-containing protein n=1 Tax=Strigamia maritima TaxID=126957 RepID=T1JAB7_STRMM
MTSYFPGNHFQHGAERQLVLPYSVHNFTVFYYINKCNTYLIMEDVSGQTDAENGSVLHVVVIGFHHKKGCQVEYSYPPLIEGDKVDSHECPDEWKHLSSLALPDGSHNYDQDTIYFLMPSRDHPGRTVFCISCYRQMNADNLLNRSADITRGSVQKSVCVISTLPLFGIIQAKLELITHAYFDERDFSKVSLLEDTFRSLNACLTADLVMTQQVFLGMPIRELVVQFKHKILLLFKLILLERKSLVFNTPVKNLCSNILSLISIFPDVIQNGLNEAANINSSASSPDIVINGDENEIFIDSTVPREYKNKFSPGCELKNDLDAATPENKNKHEYLDEIEIAEKIKKCASLPDLINNEENQLMSELDDLLDGDMKEKVDLTKSKLEFHKKDAENEMSQDGSDEQLINRDAPELPLRMSNIKGKMIGALSSYWSARNSVSSPEMEVAKNLSSSMSEGKLLDTVRYKPLETVDGEDIEHIDKIITPPSQVIGLKNEDCGFPLEIFSKGRICHPYLSLPYLDILSDSKVNAFLVGATNVLFRQKQYLSDVIIDFDEGKIEINDLELRKQLHLTTEDLRFADYLVRNVIDENTDVFLDGTGWEGGDEWLRAQFKYYLVCLLRTSLLENGNKEIEAFNLSFVDAWKSTQNYKTWRSCEYPKLMDISTGHPFQGQLSVADMKLRISHTMQSSERGRRINQAIGNTGRAVAQTGKAVGGAINQAKSAVSSWFYTLSGSPSNASPAPASQ